MPFNLPKIIGHRGVKNIAPENTLFSVYEAIKYNLKWIEIDVKISKDRIPFLLHDDFLNRTTSGKGNPINFFYKDLRNLDAGKWFDEKYIHSYPPTLKEVLDLCSKNNIGINIELKPNAGYEKENAIAVSKIFKNFKFSCPYYFSSFDWLSLIKIKKLLPNSFIGILLENTKNEKFLINLLNKCKKNNFALCGLNKKNVSKKNIKIIKDFDMLITVYSSTSIKESEASQLWNLGVDSVFIDDPTSYKEILKY